MTSAHDRDGRLGGAKHDNLVLPRQRTGGGHPPARIGWQLMRGNGDGTGMGLGGGAVRCRDYQGGQAPERWHSGILAGGGFLGIKTLGLPR